MFDKAMFITYLITFFFLSAIVVVTIGLTLSVSKEYKESVITETREIYSLDLANSIQGSGTYTFILGSSSISTRREYCCYVLDEYGYKIEVFRQSSSRIVVSENNLAYYEKMKLIYENKTWFGISSNSYEYLTLIYLPENYIIQNLLTDFNS